MKMQETIPFIRKSDLDKLPAATEAEIAEEEKRMQKMLPDELKRFYRSVSNGMAFGRLRILPVFSGKNVKKTADSLFRHNSLAHGHWFAGDEKSVREFLVFCTESIPTCFAFRRESPFVWQWNRGEDQIVELDYRFWDWLCESLRQETERHSSE